MKIGPNVRLIGIKPELLVAFTIIHAAGLDQDTELISVVDGDHDGGPLSTSSHYAGCAFDYTKKRWQEPTPAGEGWSREAADIDRQFEAEVLSGILGPEFHVLAHKTQPHIHVAYIPKRPGGVS